MTIDSSVLLEKLQHRYACKKFDQTKKIPDDTWKILEDVLVLSPSSFGLQPWKFIVVTNPALREKLKPHSWDQVQITTASHLVVIATRTDINEEIVNKHMDNIALTRSVPSESLNGYRSVISGFVSPMTAQDSTKHWTAKQSYIALGFLLETAALLDIDSCPMEGLDVDCYNQLLELNDTGFTTTVVCALGYRASDDSYASASKVRFSHDSVIEYR